ncbi:Crinkler (CRN) family protein [Phytophthora infestans T30-4]|uniref:Crinkler (CRN) family protein n=1 Tax=Phytophthora infestans (strain T30-4) TaxID=403677 RepID=D0P1N0_PHYIT|nr:Crinkler (CRN) family protein [Phytophthora infestans T30-4]EEY54662.1 Crinkler (CRN) family protein [Phytophthora infestans T30-4]|eukprot:XP_002895803.1 Crinkler (CRN) family protein [Phytophthora infestans T30-4]
MVKLVCAIVGVAGSAFPVDIDASQLVGDLKKAIKAENAMTFTGDAKDLQLFLAKKDGAWLKSKDPAVIAMRSGVIPEKVKALLDVEMDPADEIGDLFGDASTKRTIHVLVVVPDGAGGSASDTSRMDRLFDKVDKVYEHTVLSKRTRYVHSEMNSAKGNILLNDLKIRISPVDTVKFAGGVPTPAKEFKWKSDRTEEQQKEPYREYVVANIGDVLTNNKLCVVGVEKGANILTVEVPGRACTIFSAMSSQSA